MSLIRKVKLRIARRFAHSEGYRLHPIQQNNFLKILNDFWGNEASTQTKQSINGKREPIPWFTYPSIEYLSQIDLKDKSILEWGIGNSTLFFSSRCLSIDSVEHNDEWFNKISNQLPTNSTGHLVTKEEYANFPFTLNRKFDLIIVDGINRKECLESAVKLVNENGMIIFDNSDRNPEYCKMMRNNGFIEVDFHGFGPIVNFTTTTTIFFQRGFNFTPLSIQPVVPFGGGY